jgi:hypothetical protein
MPRTNRPLSLDDVNLDNLDGDFGFADFGADLFDEDDFALLTGTDPEDMLPPSYPEPTKNWRLMGAAEIAESHAAFLNSLPEAGA